MEKLNLKQLRERKRLTQKQVAEQVNKTITYISLLENGSRNPSDKLKEQLAELYGVDVNEIFLALKLTKC